MLLRAGWVAALSLLLTRALAVTGLTTDHCPDGYDLIAANITDTAFSQATVELVYGGIYSTQDRAILQQSFSQGNTTAVNDYLTDAHILTPFIIIAVAFGITYFVALCCCIFEKSCPPCQSWKRDFAAKPYENFQLKCTSLFTVGFAFAIAIVAILGFAYYPSLDEDAKMIKCSMYYSLDVAMNGDVNSNWGGFVQFATQMGNISSQLSTVGAAITASFGVSNNLTAGLASLRQQNINIYNNNKLSTVYSPNHATTNTSIYTNTPLPTVTPLFITSGLGPYTNNMTMVGDIQTGITMTEQVSTQSTKVFASAQLLANSLANIQTKYAFSINSMTANAGYLKTAQTSIDKFSTSVLDGAFSELIYFIQGVLALILVCSILILFGVLATHYLDIYSCKTCVQLGWILYGLLYFGILALCFIFFALGGISYTFCKFYGGLVNNNTQLSIYSTSTTPTPFSHLFQTISPCFSGNGSIGQSFSLTSETQTVNSLYANINTLLNMQDSTKSVYVNLNYSTDKITGWVNAMKQYEAGIYVDAPSSVTSEDNPYVALGNMNKYADNGTGGAPPTCTFDYWVFDKANCTHNSTESIYAASPTSGTAFVSTGFMCISFNQKFSSSSNSIWSPSDFTNRYISRRQCQNDTQTFDTLLQYATSLMNYRDSRINLYKTLQDQLTSLLNANSAYNGNLSAFTSSVIAFNANTSALNSLMTSSVNGLSSSTNCTVVADSLRLLYNVFCVNFIYKSVQLGLCCLVLMGIMVGGMLTGSVFAIRYSRIEKDPKVYLQDPPVILTEEVSSKREDSSDTSSSSEEE